MIHTQTFTFKQIPKYFQEKSPNLVESSFSLSESWAKTSGVVPPGRIGLLRKTAQKSLAFGQFHAAVLTFGIQTGEHSNLMRTSSIFLNNTKKAGKLRSSH